EVKDAYRSRAGGSTGAFGQAAGTEGPDQAGNAPGASTAPDGATERADKSGWPAPLDLAALAASDPVPPQHILPELMPAGEVTLASGHGGTGKSGVAMHLAACVALGRTWCGIEPAPRPVYYISCEDGRDILHWRLSWICRHLGIGMD